MSNLLKEGVKIGVVGRSGSGKTTFSDVLTVALDCQRWSAGGEMRKLKRSHSNRDLDVQMYTVQTKDDLFVDGIAEKMLLDSNFTGVMDGRTTLLLARSLIEKELLKGSDYFNITFETSLKSKGKWGLNKFRLKPGMENATVDDVMSFLSKRDMGDFERYFELYSISHGLQKVSDLYSPVLDRGVSFTREIVRGVALYPDFQKPADELNTILAILHNLTLVTDEGFLEATDRGLSEVERKGF